MERPSAQEGIRDSLALAGVTDVFLRKYLRLAPVPGENPYIYG